MFSNNLVKTKSKTLDNMILISILTGCGFSALACIFKLTGHIDYAIQALSISWAFLFITSPLLLIIDNFIKEPINKK